MDIALLLMSPEITNVKPNPDAEVAWDAGAGMTGGQGTSGMRSTTMWTTTLSSAL